MTSWRGRDGAPAKTVDVPANGLKTITDRAARAPVDRDQRIPRTIMQTFKRREVPAGLFRACASWSELNPDYEYRFYDDDACRAFIKDHFGEKTLACYEAIQNGAFRADLWRYCALYVHGGVYADADTVCRRPLSKLIRETDEFIVPFAVNRSFLFNAFICTAPGHPFLKTAIERAVELISANDFADPFKVVGPGGLGAAVNLTLGRERATRYRAGDHSVGGYSFRILRKLHTPWASGRRVLDGLQTVLMCKYDSYFSDLKASGVRHWTQ
jgi:glycosyl transferase-like sugar-binding protein